MLQEYENYLNNLNSNLLQCGVSVDFGETTEDYTDEYNRIYFYANKLNQVIYYYSLLCVSGTPNPLSRFFIDLSRYYKEEMRSMFYRESQSTLAEYSDLSVSAYLSSKSSLVENENTVNFGGNIEEEFDLFGESIGVSGETGCSESTDMVQYLKDDEVSGTYLDDIIQEPKSNEKDDEDVHGVLLDDIDTSDQNNGTITVNEWVDPLINTRGTFIDEVDTSLIDNDYLEDIEEPETGEFMEESGTFTEDSDDFINEEEPFEDDESFEEPPDGYSEEEFSEEEYNEEGSFEDEPSDGYFEETESFEEDFNKELIEDGYSEEEYTEEEESFEEELSEESSEEYIEYIEDVSFEEEFNEESFEEEYAEEDEPLEENYNEEESFEEYIEDDSTPVTEYHNSMESRGQNIGSVKSKGSPSLNGKVDLSDRLQDGVNSLLTKGKRLILSELRKD